MGAIRFGELVYFNHIKPLNRRASWLNKTERENPESHKKKF
jgi:hypothetical protein